MNNSKFTQTEAIRNKKLEVDSMEISFLQQYGWTGHSDFPDRGWRWCKKFNGKMITISQKEAYEIEKHE